MLSDVEACDLLLTPTRRTERVAKRLRVAAPAVYDSAPRRTIQDLPLEVLLQVFQWVRPSDMLTLIRTTKRFRGTLLDRTFAALVWAHALKHNVEEPVLPKCPAFLSPLKYAELVFGQHCFVCGRDAQETDLVLWEFRARYCKRCRYLRVIANNRDRPRSEQRHFQSLMDVCPTRRDRLCVRTNAPLENAMCIHTRDLKRLKRKLEGVCDQAARQKIMNQTKKETKAITKFCCLMRRWDQSWRKKRWEENEGAKERRRKHIVQRLNGLGYEKDILLLGPQEKKLAELEVVNNTKVLTDKGWEEIRPELVNFMDKRKALRMDWERVQQMRRRVAIFEMALMKHLDHAEDREPIPHALDLVNHKKIQTIIEWSADKVVEAKTFDPVLPGLIRAWQHEATDKIATQLSICEDDHYERPPSERADSLELAKTILKCSCGLTRTWPGAASHAHNESSTTNKYSGPDPHSRGFDGTLTPVPLAPFETAVRGRYFPRQPWSPDCFQGCDERVQGVFDACEKDAETTTCAQMDRLGARFECKLCSSPGKFKHLMPWRSAIWHSVRDHVGLASPALKWQKASAAEAAAAKELENTRLSKTEKEYENLSNWYCRHCYEGRIGRTRYTKYDCLAHARQYHLIPSAGDDDVAPDPDRPPFASNSVFLISDKCRRDTSSKIKDMLAAKRGCFFKFGGDGRRAR